MRGVFGLRRWVHQMSGSVGAVQCRFQSSSEPSSSSPATSAPTYDEVWGLWNEGNLFSLTVAQLDAFLAKNDASFETQAKGGQKTTKASLVRRMEEFLQSRDNAAKGLPPPQQQQQQQQQRHQQRGGMPTLQQPVSMPETLLDLTQTGFYDSPHSMAPKAFQLLVTDATPEVVISRVNTTAFPSFPANSECYTVAAADAALALRTRFSKAFQWCGMNMANLRIDGEFQADFGKFIVSPSVMKKKTNVVSAYSLQQRLQVANSGAYTWVSAASEESIPAMEALVGDEGFVAVGKRQLSYDVHVRRAKDVIAIELNRQMQATAVNNVWHNLQTSHVVSGSGMDTRLLIRTRTPLRRADIDHFSNTPVLKMANEEISDVLPPEHGEVIYASENEVRRWEKRQTMSGARFTLVETRRQPLIVLHEHEEDMRLEYQLIASLPSQNQSEKVDLRTLSLELFDTAKIILETLNSGFVNQFKCEAEPVVAKRE